MILLHIEQEILDAAIICEPEYKVWERYRDWERLDRYMEHIEEMKSYRIKYMCDRDGCFGEMIYKGEALLSYPPKFTHVCEKCGSTNVFERCYPTISYKKTI